MFATLCDIGNDERKKLFWCGKTALHNNIGKYHRLNEVVGAGFSRRGCRQAASSRSRFVVQKGAVRFGGSSLRRRPNTKRQFSQRTGRRLNWRCRTLLISHDESFISARLLAASRLEPRLIQERPFRERRRRQARGRDRQCSGYPYYKPCNRFRSVSPRS